MAEFASNTPISRPVDLGLTADWDLNGISWSYEWGMFYEAPDDLLPLRNPTNPIQEYQ